MKKLILNLLVIGLLTSAIAQAGTVRIYNNDSEAHVVKLKCNGNTKTLEVRASSTSSYTFDSTARRCEIVGGTVSFSVSQIENGQSWKFKNNKASKA